MVPRIKICGLTSPEDVRAVVAAGTDAIGLMFYEPSPRNLTLARAREVAAEIPVLVSRVGVFVDAPDALVRDAIAALSLDVVQFHGNESPEYCAAFTGVRVLKAFRIKDESSLAQLPAYSGVDAWLLDSYVKGVPGGSGERFNWDLAVQAKAMGKPILLAGGLTTENVAEAVARVQPWGLDVSSGVERSPGVKDAAKAKAFIANAKGFCP